MIATQRAASVERKITVRKAKDWRAWLAGKVGRKGDKTYRVRILVQSGFALTCVLLGIQFGRFVSAARAGELPLPQRPPGVEGFLPISGLMGLLDWIYQGTLNTIHPAATILFTLFLVMSVVFRKSFCSWVCPIGFLSEALARLGRAIFGRNFRIWRWLDFPLRGLKYLLLAFFLWAIFNMSAEALRAFIESPYNRVSDVKTGLFFVDIGQVGINVLIVLALGSILVKGLWCRYLCPYGALLGLVSWMSPAKIRRDPVSCIDCGLCDKVCMARQPVSQKLSIWSPECTSCLDCVAVCPIKDALNVQVARKTWSARRYAAALLLLFLAGYAGARAFDLWDNRISDGEYILYIQQDASVPFAHPGV